MLPPRASVPNITKSPETACSPGDFVQTHHQLRFASDVVSGIGRGFIDSLKSAWDTAKSLATDPKGMWNDMKAGISALSDLVASGDLKEVLGSLAPEVSQLIACWAGASDFSRGEMVGNVLGQYGPDVIVAIVTGGASLGATAAKGGIKALKTLKRLAKRGSCSFLTGTLVLTPSGLVAMEEVPLGGRVVTAEDEGLLSRPGDTLAETEDEVSSWLRVKVTLPSTSGAEAVELDLLRPVWWLADVGLIREGWVELRKPVLGRMGAALVESIEHAPDLADGTGSAVVGRIRHDAGWLTGIRFEETHEPALVTVGQTFWSESHQAWLSADRLRPGMVMLGGAGPLTVASTSHFRASGHEVVDLEVLGADGMLVGPRLVAAHNCGGAGKAARGGSRGPDKLKPDPNADGAHSTFRRNPATGRIENYETFDPQGQAGGNKRFRGTGRPHGGVEAPLVLEPRPGHPGGKPKRARPARPEEIPSGFDDD